MQQLIFLSLFALASIIPAHLNAMDLSGDPTSTQHPLNAIEEKTQQLVSFIQKKKDHTYSTRDINKVRSFIDQGAQVSDDTFCLVHDLVNYNQEVLVSDLIKAGANVNHNIAGNTPLFTACQPHVHPSIMHILLHSKADTNHRDSQGNIAFHHLVYSLKQNAPRMRVKDKICLLLHYGADIDYLNKDLLSASALLNSLGLSKDRAGKTDTIEQLLISGTAHAAYTQWADTFLDYESEKALKAQRFEEFLVLAKEFEDHLYQPSDRNINRSDSCPEYPRFSMFTSDDTEE